MEILILLGLIIINGLFAMSEIALVTARKARLGKMVDQGDRSAAVALRLGENPTVFLSTVQIGITSIGLLNGIVGEAVLAEPLAAWLRDTLKLSPSVAGISSTVVVVALVTYVSIVVGELVPKRIGQINPESIARLVARPMQALSVAARPFVALLTVSTNGLLKLAGIRQDRSADVTEEEIFALLKQGSEAGVIEPEEHALVRSVLRLDDRQLSTLMVPRSEIDFLDVNLADEENLKRLLESTHSRFPVCDGGLDNVLGIAYGKEVLTSVLKQGKADFRSNLRPAIYVPETLSGMELLEKFRDENVRLAFVVNEYGGVDGLVTLKDLMTALTGELGPPGDEEPRIVLRPDGSWLLDGGLSLAELKPVLSLKNLPEGGYRRYQTLSGLIMVLLEKIPSTGDFVLWEGLRFEVVDMDGKRIDKVLVTESASDGR